MTAFLSQYSMAIIWFLILVAAIVIETQTETLVAIWFMPAALAALILSFWVKQVWIQILVFVVLASILLFISQFSFKKLLKKDAGKKTNLDAMIGKKAILTEEVNNLHGTGTLTLNGVIWSVRAKDDDIVIPVGTTVTIIAINGVKLIVEP